MDNVSFSQSLSLSVSALQVVFFDQSLNVLSLPNQNVFSINKNRKVVIVRCTVSTRFFAFIFSASNWIYIKTEREKGGRHEITITLLPLPDSKFYKSTIPLFSCSSSTKKNWYLLNAPCDRKFERLPLSIICDGWWISKDGWVWYILFFYLYVKRRENLNGTKNSPI